jgi:hypothetical protein
VSPTRLILQSKGIGTGQSSTAKVTIRNLAPTGTLTGNVSLTNKQAGTAFILSQPGPFNLPPHGTLPETITFTPDGTSDGAMLSITSNDPKNGSISIQVSGAGLPGVLSAPKTLPIVGTATVSKSSGTTFQSGTKNLILRNIGRGVCTSSDGAIR